LNNDGITESSITKKSGLFLSPSPFPIIMW
jgi:hypothetical protein